MENSNFVCKRCVMDHTVDQIEFDKDGICDHCRTFDNAIAPFWDNSD